MMSLRKIIFCIYMALLAATMVFSQRSTSAEGRVPTVAERLQSHHVDLSIDSLVDALRNPNPEVRSLAAAQLAAEKARAGIPALLSSLTSEKNPGVRVNFAVAIARLGEPSGSLALRNICGDAAVSGSDRILAAHNLLDLGSADCFDATVDISTSQSDGSVRTEALSLLPLFKGASVDTRKILVVLREALEDRAPVVRLSASDALERLADVSAVGYLQKAIAVEKNKSVRAQMQANLSRLELHK